MATVWITIHGSGDDGDESKIEAVFDSKEKAEADLEACYGKDWSKNDRNRVEEWPVN